MARAGMGRHARPDGPHSAHQYYSQVFYASEILEARMSTPTTAPRPFVPESASERAAERAGVQAAPTKITVRGLNFFYGHTQALSNISIDIVERVVMAFIGPSGCGKSTFLRTLNRMNDTIPGTRAEGQVLLDGQD